jgi:hypothetical protein
MIETKLLYGLSCCCLSVAQQRRLNGFQSKCLRKIIGIQPSFISRIPNKEVLRRAGHVQASELLLQTQLGLLGKVLRAPATSQLRTSALTPGTLQPATARFVRRVGRPRKEWIPLVIAEAHRRAGHNDLQDLALDPLRWKMAMSF